MASIQEVLTAAFQHHQAGNLAQAEQLYGQILQAQPQHVDALHLLGLICQRTGRLTQAVETIRQALHHKPDYAEAHSNLGIVLRQLGRLDEAIASYREALRLKPNNAEAHNNLGVALREQKRFEEAIARYREALRLKPTYAEAYNNLGIALTDQGKFEDAVASFQTALRLKPNHAEAFNNLGNTLRRQGKLDEAVASFHQALRLRPNHADTHYNLGVVHAEQGRLDEAVSCYQQALHLKPNNSETLNNLGVAFTEQHRLEEAEAVLRQAVELRPNYPEAHNNLGNTLKEQGRLDEALACFHEALHQRPDFAAAHINLGAVRMEQGQPEQAAACYQRALGLQPDYPEALSNLGTALLELGQADQAVERCQEALRLKPDNPEALNNLGAALRGQGRLGEAVACYRSALQRRPSYPEALVNLGVALTDQGQLEEAIACYQQALRLQPDNAEAHNNMGLALAGQGQYEDAISSFQQALRLKPEHAAALNNLGNTLCGQGKPDEAVSRYQQLLQADGGPRSATRPAQLKATAHMNRAMAWLLMGDFERGWPEYEWRWQCKDNKDRPFIQPRWDGSPLGGRTILLHAEQGLGDTIQFVRYAPLVRQRGGRVLVECPKALLDLLSRCRGIDQLLQAGTTLPPFDVHAPLLSLPGIFRTTLATMPAEVPYLFADAERCDRWLHPLAELPGRKVGIVWQGNPKHKGDRYRSVPLTRFEPLARMPNVRLISLQKGPGAEQLQMLNGRFEVVDLGAHEKGEAWTFADTAAVVANLDLVIGVDTAVVHLAGALGVPAWVLLPAAPDWRWLLSRDDSPWYPTLRLFRQHKPGDWDNVFARVAAALEQYLPPADSEPARRSCRLAPDQPVPVFDGPAVDSAGAQLDAGVALARDGKLDAARVCFEEALRLRPAYAEALYNLGILQAQQDRVDEAISRYREALALAPEFAPAHINLGVVLAKQGNFDEAIACYGRALQLQPDSVEANINLGTALLDRDRLEEAEVSLRHALRLAPDRAETHYNLGSLYARQARVEEAVASLRTALRLRYDYADALLNLGNVYLDNGRTAEATAALEGLLRLHPEHADAHKNLGIVRLLAGDYERGWPEYEWRWQCGGLSPRPFAQPLWDGSALSGRTILLHAEQGLGDTIQFLRYAPLVKRRGGRVIVECQPALAILTATCAGVDEVVPRGAALSAFDVHAPLLSVPRILGTTLATVPAEVPYLHSDRACGDAWRRELAALPGLKVGVVWQGNPGHKDDRCRSVPLARFEPLARMPNVRLISLQKGAGAEQLSALGGRFDVLDLGHRLQSDSWTFTDTAALLSALDLVVGVDTAVIHLAGALGLPVWVALAFAPDWRWLLERDKSPWYPSMRLFRQDRPGEWDEVFHRLARALWERQEGGHA